jgi:hypothetical protein
MCACVRERACMRVCMPVRERACMRVCMPVCEHVFLWWERLSLEVPASMEIVCAMYRGPAKMHSVW